MMCSVSLAMKKHMIKVAAPCMNEQKLRMVLRCRVPHDEIIEVDGSLKSLRDVGKESVV